MKYYVIIDFKTFRFDNLADASTFATLAKKHWCKMVENSDIDVSIEILTEDESKGELN